MLAIYKRELKSYFDSVIGFIFIAIMLFITGLYCLAYNLEAQYPDISYALYYSVFIMMIATPILSMKVMADERKNKTDQLIYTSPVSISGIVIGKFLALMTVLLIVCAIICLVPLYLNKSSFGEGIVPMRQSYVAILAYFIYGAACLSVGLFVSSLCESQVIAAVITFAALFVSYMMEGIVSFLPDKLEKLGDILMVLCMSTRFGDLIEGTFDLKALLYFVTVIFIMVYLTIQSVQKRRYSVSVRNLSLGSYNLFMVVAVIAIAVVINMAANLLPIKYTEIDVTADKIFTLSADTENFVKNMDEDVTVYVMSSEDNTDTYIKKTLESISDLTEHIDFEYVDLTISPMFYTNYTDDSSQIGVGDLVVDAKDSYKIISYSDIYEWGYDYTTYSQYPTGYDGEGQLLSALDYVTGETKITAYCLKGHSEDELDDTFMDVLGKANVDVEYLTLLNAESVPEDASCVIINYPQTDLSDDDLEKLTDYVNAGGKLYINCPVTTLENMNKLLAIFGTQIQDRLVFDTDRNHYYQYPQWLLPDIISTEYTSSMSDKYVFAPSCYQMVFSDEDENLAMTGLLSTSDSAMAAKVDSQGNITDDTAEGTFFLGIAVDKTIDDETTATAIIFASYELLTEEADMMVSNGNQKFFKDTIYNLMPQTKGKVSVGIKSLETQYLTVTEGDIGRFRIVAVYLIPVAMLLAGIGTWISRRRR